ncbi:hypothetical protein J4233_04485 [Candidatus Pacearchaeota archaeon]|nr:hypothetical protein [Candidatus Pacearchaeota archaeon]
MKKSGAYLLLVFLVVAVVGIVVYSFIVFRPSEEAGEEIMLAPLTIHFPANCSDFEIKAVWDSVFLVSSDNIYIATNNTGTGACTAFYAYKSLSSNATYVMGGYAVRDNSGINGPYVEINSSNVFYFYGNLTFVDTEFLNFTSDLVGNPFYIFAILGVGAYFDAGAYNWTQVPIEPYEKFKSQFNYMNDSAFVWSSPLFTIDESTSMSSSGITGTNKTLQVNSTVSALVHGYNQTMAYIGSTTRAIQCSPNWTCTDWGACNGTVQNRTCTDQRNCGIAYGRPSLTQSCSLACMPNWTAVNATTICNSNETFVIWYNDTKRCANMTRPANTTGYCDYGNNGLIGKLSDIAHDNLDVDALKINNSAVNYSKNYTGDKYVELIEDVDDVDIVRVRFRYDFDDGPLNLKTVRIEKQDDESEFGYLIVDGLDVTNKDFRVDKIYDSGAVCVKDYAITNINEIDDECEGNDEYIIVCPGKSGEFNCSDGGSGTYLVRGLDNSGVRELADTVSTTTTTTTTASQGSPACQVDWDCGLWGDCVGGVQKRLCTDLSTCPGTNKSYNQTQACTEGCTPSWKCGNWTSKDCGPGEEQNQECTDLNGCEADQTRTRDCPEDGGGGIDWMLIGIVIAAAVIVLAAIILIIVVKKRRNARVSEENSIVLQKPLAGNFNPTHYGGQGFGR